MSRFRRFPVSGPTVSPISLVLLVFVGAVFGLSLPLQAEPIRVTGGTIQGEPVIQAVRIALEGEGFSIRTGSGEDFYTPLAGCLPCESPVVNLGSRWQIGQSYGGQALVNGVRYDNVLFSPGTVMTFTTPNVTLTGTAAQTVSVPFTMTGVLKGYSDPNQENLLFSVDVTGRGTARARFSTFMFEGQTFYNTTTLPGTDYRLEYQFSAVPEPGTLLLVATGVVSVVSKTYRRSRQARRSVALA